MGLVVGVVFVFVGTSSEETRVLGALVVLGALRALRALRALLDPLHGKSHVGHGCGEGEGGADADGEEAGGC